MAAPELTISLIGVLWAVPYYNVGQYAGDSIGWPSKGGVGGGVLARLRPGKRGYPLLLQIMNSLKIGLGAVPMMNIATAIIFTAFR